MKKRPSALSTTKFLLVALSILIHSCNSHHNSISPLTSTKPPPDSLQVQIEHRSYIDIKNNISKTKKELAKNYNHPLSAANIADLQKQFTQVLTDSIFPFWYGTTWDFNGTTQEPGKGFIACGYFITTTLQDAGLPIKRIKLAQCASQLIIADVVKHNHKKVFSNVSLNDFLLYIKGQGFGIYIVGLDSHVGFLYNDGREIYFIHAKWVNPKAVVKEVASQSGILSSSAYKIVGKISDDPIFLERWLNGK